MTRFLPLFIKSAAVQYVESEWCVTDRVNVYALDCHSALDQELDFIVPFQLKPKPTSNSTGTSTNLNAFVISFDVVFDAPGTRYGCM